MPVLPREVRDEQPAELVGPEEGPQRCHADDKGEGGDDVPANSLPRVDADSVDGEEPRGSSDVDTGADEHDRPQRRVAGAGGWGEHDECACHA